jgi:hypothetical protein
MASTVSTEPRFFLHIPKSAGTSVHVALEQALPPGAISPKRRDATWARPTASEIDALGPAIRAQTVVEDDDIAALGDYAVVSGHFALPTLLRVTRASEVATVLREPRARVLSQYASWRLLSPTERDMWGLALDQAQQQLDEFLSAPWLAALTDNVVCRMLLAGDRRIRNTEFIRRSDVDAVAEAAIKAIETLGYVGLLELGESVWEGLSAFFGVALAPTHRNATASQSDTADAPAARRLMTPDTLDLLHARTAADTAVHRHVLLASGCTPDHADRLEATAFAAELVRIGDLTGPSAAEARAQGARLAELNQELGCREQELRLREGELRLRDDELRLRDDELQREEALLVASRDELAQTMEQLRLHRIWLDGIQGSASWRLTAPLRASKRVFRRHPSGDDGLGGRS